MCACRPGRELWSEPGEEVEYPIWRLCSRFGKDEHEGLHVHTFAVRCAVSSGVSPGAATVTHGRGSAEPARSRGWCPGHWSALCVSVGTAGHMRLWILLYTVSHSRASRGDTVLRVLDSSPSHRSSVDPARGSLGWLWNSHIIPSVASHFCSRAGA